MIKLVASDIDGTLVKDGTHRINPEYYDVIRELEEVGIRFCACSGRQFDSILRLFEPVADHIFFICDNGTVLRTKDRILHHWTIEPDLYLPLLNEIRKIDGAEAIVSDPHSYWIESGENSEMMYILRDGYRAHVNNVSDLGTLPPDNIVKVCVSHHGIEEATAELQKDPRFSHLTMTVSGERWLEAYPREAGKGEAYALLQEYLGVKIEETVYFGDNMNDLSAFREAGVTATVANARKELQKAADKVERSYSDDGVLRELRNILAHRKAFLEANQE